MKAQKTPSLKIPKTGPAAANLFHANRTSASPAEEKARESGNHPARLSSEERRLAIELAPHWRAARRSFAHDSREQDWLEAEIAIELDRMRKRYSQPSD